MKKCKKGKFSIFFGQVNAITQPLIIHNFHVFVSMGSPRCIELCPNQQKGQASGSWKFGNIIQILFVEIKKSRPSGDFFYSVKL